MNPMDMIEKFKAIFERMLESDDAAIYSDDTGLNNNVLALTLSTSDLGTAKLSTQPKELTFPFRSLYVNDATDQNVVVYLRLSSMDGGSEKIIPLKKGVAIKLPFPVRKAFLHWSAQTSKTMSILFSLRGEISSNDVNSVQSGSVSIGFGDTVTPQTAGTISDTAALLIAANSSRKKLIIGNEDSIPFWISGDATVTTDTGTVIGIKIMPGEYYEWLSTSAVYQIGNSVGTDNKISMQVFT